jgi:L-threonylcarbamoyladenylate synthase
MIVYPTSTLYGLGGDATDPSVAARIRGIKGNREAPFVLLAASPQDAFALAADVPEAARRLADRHWPGPLTLVLPAADHVPATVTGPDGTIAVRVDPHPFPRALAKAAGCPLISTSANLAGRPAPGTSDAVAPDIVGACDLFVVDPAPLGGRPSTLVRVVGDRITVLREGALPASAFQAPAPESP